MFARDDELFHCTVMTAATDTRVVQLRLFATWNVVRVVTGRALQRAFALLKTFRASQPVHCAGDFKLVLATRRRCGVEIKHKIGYRSTWRVGERFAIKSHERFRQPEPRCLEVALHAPLHLSVGI